jgi:hypothetical protein
MKLSPILDDINGRLSWVLGLEWKEIAGVKAVVRYNMPSLWEDSLAQSGTANTYEDLYYLFRGLFSAVILTDATIPQERT